MPSKMRFGQKKKKLRFSKFSRAYPNTAPQTHALSHIQISQFERSNTFPEYIHTSSNSMFYFCSSSWIANFCYAEFQFHYHFRLDIHAKPQRIKPSITIITSGNQANETIASKMYYFSFKHQQLC